MSQYRERASFKRSDTAEREFNGRCLDAPPILLPLARERDRLAGSSVKRPAKL
jgi:hypothetical protein